MLDVLVRLFAIEGNKMEIKDNLEANDIDLRQQIHN